MEEARVGENGFQEGVEVLEKRVHEEFLQTEDVWRLGEGEEMVGEKI